MSGTSLKFGFVPTEKFIFKHATILLFSHQAKEFTDVCKGMEMAEKCNRAGHDFVNRFVLFLSLFSKEKYVNYQTK